jgi:hypothetical protein
VAHGGQAWRQSVVSVWGSSAPVVRSSSDRRSSSGHHRIELGSRGAPLDGAWRGSMTR